MYSLMACRATSCMERCSSSERRRRASDSSSASLSVIAMNSMVSLMIPSKGRDVNLICRRHAPGRRPRASARVISGVGIARYLVSDLLQLGFVGDALPVVAGSVGPFEGGDLLAGEFDAERGD